MKILWINDDAIDGAAIERLKSSLNDRFTDVDLTIIDRSLFSNEGPLVAAIEQVQRVVGDADYYLLIDCRICGDVLGGWKIANSLLGTNGASALIRAAVCSDDLHPPETDPRWTSNKTKIWRFRAPSSSPQEIVCRQIARFLRTGSLFLEVAATALAALEHPLRFIRPDLSRQTRGALKGMFSSGVGVADGLESCSPFNIAHAIEWEAFPKTFNEFARNVGINISPRDREKYDDAFVSWKRTLCPFTSLEYAVRWKIHSEAGIEKGGALRLLWELGDGSNVRQYFTAEQPTKTLDWVQCDWLKVKFAELQKRLERISDAEVQVLVAAASNELNDASQFIADLSAV